MQMVICPNGGRCGSRKHRLGTKAYQQCFEQSTSGGGQISRDIPILASVYEGQDRRLSNIKTMQEIKVYSAAESFINKDMVIQEDMVQAYINNPDDINELCREEWEGHIRDDIEGYSEEIFNKLGMDIDEYDSEEIEYVLDAALEADRSDIAGAMARNMKPRTFTHFCSPTEMGRRAAFDKAMQKYKVGSDEWYYTLADGYHRDLKDSHLRYPGRAGMGGSKGDEDRQAIASALKQAIGDNPGEIDSDYYSLPSIEVVWTGNLSDVGPNDDDGSSEKLHVMYPHFVLTDGMGGVYNNPVQLHGDYVIDLPSREDRLHGAESGILDDMTMDRFRYFNYPDGVGLSQYSAADVYRTFE